MVTGRKKLGRRITHQHSPNNQRFDSSHTSSLLTKLLRIFQLFFGVILDCGFVRKILNKMLGCNCFTWSRVNDLIPHDPDFFSLPEPLPQWPQGSGFATSRIKLGELEVCQITNFEFIWGSNPSTDGKHSISFYKPISIPDGFSCLGHCCQSDEKPLRGYVIVARDQHNMSALTNPVDYSLVWSSYDGDDNFDGCGYFWLPQPPEGYKALGFMVTNKSSKPDLDEVKCVCADLTDTSQACRLIASMDSKFPEVTLTVWNVRPLHRGTYARGVSVGTFYCSSSCSLGDELTIACLKNLDHNLHAMPNIDQIHALVRHYGPTVFFHPNELYLPSSVSWFFENGALLYRRNDANGQVIDVEGSNLPGGGSNDGQCWIDKIYPLMIGGRKLSMAT